MAKKHKIVFPRDGIATGEAQPRALYTPLTDRLIGCLGEKTTQRASHVEPTSELSAAARDWIKTHAAEEGYDITVNDEPGKLRLVDDQYMYAIWANAWWADLTPVGGPVLGPLDTRESALDAEETWLHAHNIPYCRPCADSPTGRPPSSGPNFQFLSEKHGPVDMSAAEAITFDFSSFEETVLNYYREQVAEAMFSEAFPGRTVEDYNGWERTGDVWRRVAFLTNELEEDQPTEKHVVLIKFEPGQCRATAECCQA